MMLFLEEVCSNQNILAVIYFVWTIVSWVLRIVPIVLIVMVSLDFAKNVMANGADAMNKNLKMVISRIISCVLCFLVPSFVTTLNTILGDFGVNYSKCFDNIANGVHVDNNSGSLIEDSGNDNKPNVNIGGGSSVSPSSGVSGGGSSSSGGSTSSSGSTTTGSAGSNASTDISKLKTYQSYKVIKTLKTSDLKDKIVLSTKNRPYCYGAGQSIVVVGNRIIVTQSYTCVENWSKNYVTILDLNTRKEVKTRLYEFYHANGMTYNPNTGKIYINLGYNHSYIYAVNANDVANGSDTNIAKKNISGTKTGFGFAYDSKTNKYYSQKTSPRKMYVFDENFKLDHTFSLVTSPGGQDMTAYNGIGMIAKSRGEIDFYRLTDGKYLGSYSLPSKSKDGISFEYESIVYSGSGNEFLVFISVKGSKDHIYTITINFDDFK